MAATKNITQLLVLSCLLLLPCVFALSKESKKVIKEINSKGPYYGLISSSSSVDEVFFASNEFTADSEFPFLDLSGRRFHVGTVQGRNVIYVNSGAGLVNAAAVTQLLLVLVDVRGIVHFGLAGNTDDSLNIGDVIIPQKFVNTGLWNWKNPDATIPSSDFAELVFKDFNVPKEGDNSLGRIGYSPEEFYSNASDPNADQQIIWFNVDSKWLNASYLLKVLLLKQCVNGTLTCLENRPKVVVGVNGTTSNIFVDNKAYRGYLSQTFEVSSADKESTAVIATSLSNGYPVISIRGLVNLAGAEEKGEDYSVFKPLVAANVAHVVVRFMDLLRESQVPESLIKMYE